MGSAASYLEDVRGVHVVADAAERRELIEQGLGAAGEWIDPMAKLDEVVHLVEWPVVLEGKFDERYLELPDRVTITAMQSHQRYFPIVADGKLAWEWSSFKLPLRQYRGDVFELHEPTLGDQFLTFTVEGPAVTRLRVLDVDFKKIKQ